MAWTAHPLRDGHPDDAALGDTPLVSLGQGDYRRDIMPDDVSPGHTKADGDKAFTRLAQDIKAGTPLGTPPVRPTDAYVPLADAKPAPLPTLKPITEQVRKLDAPAPKMSAVRLRAEAATEQCEEELRRNHIGHLFVLCEEMANVQARGGALALAGEPLILVRRALACMAARLMAVDEDAEGGVS